MGKNLVINGADFSENAIPQPVFLNKVIVVYNSGAACSLRQNQTPRSTLLVYDSNATNNLWFTDTSADYPNKASYFLNKIPAGAKSISVQYDGVTLSCCLYTSAYRGCFSPSWSGSGAAQVINISNYPTAVYYSVNFQKESLDLSKLNIQFTY